MYFFQVYQLLSSRVTPCLLVAMQIPTQIYHVDFWHGTVYASGVVHSIVSNISNNLLLLRTYTFMLVISRKH